MNQTLRLTLIVGLAALLLLSLGRMAKIARDYRIAQERYETLREEVFQIETPPPSGETEEALPVVHIDLAGLQARNPDVVGWLWIPDTEVNYPVMQAADNQKYLTRDFYLNYDVGGSIFMDYRNQADASDENTILYGHNMKNKAMFGGLKLYAALEYRQEHPDLYLFTQEGMFRYQIFAAYKTESSSPSYTREFSEGEKGAFLRYIASCAGETRTELPEENARLLTLSTCTSVRKTERFVLHAALLETGP